MHTCDNIGKASKKSIGALCGRSCFSCLDFFFPGLLPIWSITHFDALLPLGLDIRFVVASDPVSNGNKVCGRNTNNKNMDKGGKREAFCQQCKRLFATLRAYQLRSWVSQELYVILHCLRSYVASRTATQLRNMYSPKSSSSKTYPCRAASSSSLSVRRLLYCLCWLVQFIAECRRYSSRLAIRKSSSCKFEDGQSMRHNRVKGQKRRSVVFFFSKGA